MGQRVQINWPRALGHFALYKPIGVCDLFWMLPWQLAHSAGVFSRWCFFEKWFNLLFFFFLLLLVQYQERHHLPEFPLHPHLVWYTRFHLDRVVLKWIQTFCAWINYSKSKRCRLVCFYYLILTSAFNFSIKSPRLVSCDHPVFTRFSAF